MTRGTVQMSYRDQYRYQVLQQLINGAISASQASHRLGLSPRQVRRLKHRVASAGASGIIHLGRGRPSAKKRSADIIERIRMLYREKYNGWNMQHFSEALSDYEMPAIEISRESLRKILLDEPSRPTRRKRPHRRYRTRRTQAGDLLQMDASLHDWLGIDGEECVLISAVDDATGAIVSGSFFPKDNLHNNLSVVRDTVIRHGIPCSLYLDGNNTYFLDDQTLFAAWERGDDGLTQFGAIMKTLGIEMIHARSPQAKGRVERSYRTLQDRLLKELRLYDITTIESSNRYLHDIFIPKYNEKFSVPAADTTSAYVPVGSDFDANDYFYSVDTRVIQNDYTVRYKRGIYQLETPCPRARQRVEIRIWLDGSLHIYHKNRELTFEKIVKIDKNRRRLRRRFIM